MDLPMIQAVGREAFLRPEVYGFPGGAAVHFCARFDVANCCACFSSSMRVISPKAVALQIASSRSKAMSAHRHRFGERRQVHNLLVPRGD